jgi:hypothetical protein
MPASSSRIDKLRRTRAQRDDSFWNEEAG